jgi:hypothetical protein
MGVADTDTIGKMSLRAILPIGGAGFAPLTGAVGLRTTSPIKRVPDMAKSPSKLVSEPRREPAPPLAEILVLK